MRRLRKYGGPPYNVAVIHGGPGAPGEMAPVAGELSATCGILEPLQTRDTLEGQLEELKALLQDHARLPVVLIGHSWGAMLSYVLSAREPSLVKKLIMVGSGVFEEKYAAGIMETRLSRLSEEERADVDRLLEELDAPAAEAGRPALPQFSHHDIEAALRDRPDNTGHGPAETALDLARKDRAFARLGQLLARADSYAPLPDTPNDPTDTHPPSRDPAAPHPPPPHTATPRHPPRNTNSASPDPRGVLLNISDDETVDFSDPPHGQVDIIQPQFRIYKNVWGAAEEMRRSGALLSMGPGIKCPVVAIHGDYDPHPYVGVSIPLSRVLSDFRFILLERCGHRPWHEKHARDDFYSILRHELLL